MIENTNKTTKQNVEQSCKICSKAKLSTSQLTTRKTFCNTKQMPSLKTHTHMQRSYSVSIHGLICAMKGRQAQRACLRMSPFRPAKASHTAFVTEQQGKHSPRWKRRLKCVSAQTDWVQQLTQRCLNCGWQG